MVGTFTPTLLGVSGPGEPAREDLCRKAVAFFTKSLATLPPLGREACFCAGGLLRGHSSPESLDTGSPAPTSMDEAVCARRTASFTSGLWGASFRYTSGGAEYRRLWGEPRVHSSCVLTTENRPTVLAGELPSCCPRSFWGDSEARVPCIWGRPVWLSSVNVPRLLSRGWAEDSPGTPLLRSAGSRCAGKAEAGTSLRRRGKGKFSPRSSREETPPTRWASQRTLLTWGALGAGAKPEAVAWLKDDSAVGTSKSLLGLVWRTRAGVGALKLNQIRERAGCPPPKEGGPAVSVLSN